MFQAERNAVQIGIYANCTCGEIIRFVAVNIAQLPQVGEQFVFCFTESLQFHRKVPGLKQFSNLFRAHCRRHRRTAKPDGLYIRRTQSQSLIDLIFHCKAACNSDMRQCYAFFIQT